MSPGQTTLVLIVTSPEAWALGVAAAVSTPCISLKVALFWNVVSTFLLNIVYKISDWVLKGLMSHSCSRTGERSSTHQRVFGTTHETGCAGSFSLGSWRSSAYAKVKRSNCFDVYASCPIPSFLLFSHRFASCDTLGLSIGGRRLRKGCVGSFHAALCTTLSLGRVGDNGGFECPSTAVPGGIVKWAPHEGPLQWRGSCLTGSLVECSVPLFWGAGWVSNEMPFWYLFGQIQM